MLTNYDSNPNIDEMTDIEIYAAIRYLEVYRRHLDQQNADDQGGDSGIVICICLSVALLLANLWFYWQ
jgi:hypothetical protein